MKVPPSVNCHVIDIQYKKLLQQFCPYKDDFIHAVSKVFIPHLFLLLWGQIWQKQKQSIMTWKIHLPSPDLNPPPLKCDTHMYQPLIFHVAMSSNNSKWWIWPPTHETSACSNLTWVILLKLRDWANQWSEPLLRQCFLLKLVKWKPFGGLDGRLSCSGSWSFGEKKGLL